MFTWLALWWLRRQGYVHSWYEPNTGIMHHQMVLSWNTGRDG